MVTFGINPHTAIMALEGSQEIKLAIGDDHNNMHAQLASSGSLFNPDRSALLMHFTPHSSVTPINAFDAYMSIEDVTTAFELPEPFNFPTASKRLRSGIDIAKVTITDDMVTSYELPSPPHHH
jgi:hypothetical protein